MARVVKENNRRVFIIEPGDNIDQVLAEFLSVDAVEVVGEVNKTRYHIDKSVIVSMNELHGINAIKEVVTALEKEQTDENKSTEE